MLFQPARIFCPSSALIPNASPCTNAFGGTGKTARLMPAFFSCSEKSAIAAKAGGKAAPSSGVASLSANLKSAGRKRDPSHPATKYSARALAASAFSERAPARRATTGRTSKKAAANAERSIRRNSALPSSPRSLPDLLGSTSPIYRLCPRNWKVATSRAGLRPAPAREQFCGRAC